MRYVVALVSVLASVVLAQKKITPHFPGAAAGAKASSGGHATWTNADTSVTYPRGNGFAFGGKNYYGPGGTGMACGTGANLAQTYAQNFNAASTTPWNPASLALNPTPASQTGRKTGGWEGCCIMKGTPKGGDAAVPGGTTSVDVLDTGDIVNQPSTSTARVNGSSVALNLLPTPFCRPQSGSTTWSGPTTLSAGATQPLAKASSSPFTIGSRSEEW